MQKGGARTVQGELESVWRAITGLEERLTLAGRTDAGVHAEHQVGNIRTRSAMPVGELQARIPASLPGDLRLLDLSEVDCRFDARHSALWREYRYDLPRAPYLDIGRMSSAASRLVGEHDFSAYSSAGALGPRGAVRRVLALRVSGREEAASPRLRVVADAFLRQMVRRIVSALLLVGRGKIGAAEITRGLELRDRSLLPGPAPASELTLVRIGYEEYRE